MVVQTAGAVDDWSLLRATTPKGEVLSSTVQALSAQCAQVEYLGTPICLAYPFRLPEIGRVYLWTVGSKGLGYSTRAPLSVLEAKFLRSRIDRVERFMRQYARRGVPLETAQNLLQQAKALTGEANDPNEILKALSFAVRAGEQAVVSLASARLQRMGGREIFLWGAQLTNPAQPGELFPPLNMVALSLESPETDWSNTVQKLARERIALKAENLITREDIAHARGLLSQDLLDCLKNSIDRYRGQIRYWSLFADLASFRTAGIPLPRAVETIGQACETARQLDFGIVRILAGSNSLYARFSAFQVIDACLEQDVPCEGIQLNLNWHDHDLFDFDHLLETAGDWAKPIHLSLHLPPQTSDLPLYREDRLEWFAGAYLIALSKPYVVALQVPMFADAHSAGLRASEQTLSPFGERLRTLLEP